MELARMKVTKIVGLAAASMLLAGCAGSISKNPPVEVFDDMDRQPKYKAQSANTFFADGRTQRPRIEGTVARGALHEDDLFSTGIVGDSYAGLVPLEKVQSALGHDGQKASVDEVLKVGQAKFDTYCSPCHSRTGSGRGIVSVKAGWIASSLHDERARAFPDGYVFHVISNGVRSMPGYRTQITESERWAIVTYVRVLQKMQTGTMADVPQELQKGLE